MFLRTVLVFWIVAMAGGFAQPAVAFVPPETVSIPPGNALIGSDRTEREAAYLMDERAYGHAVTRQRRWYEAEPERQIRSFPAFDIMRDPVTNADYLHFVRMTGHRVPDVAPAIWKGYGLIHPYDRTRRHAWLAGAPPPNRLSHPVVLVSHGDAVAYARWLSRKTGAVWRLPTEVEWERAARGDEGWYFPWGNDYDPARLNSHDLGPFDTVPAGSFPETVSPHGLRDAAGQVFEWTSTSTRAGGHIVKGGSWDDRGCGVCRPAARHGRPDELKHILIGFRLVREIE